MYRGKGIRDMRSRRNDNVLSERFPSTRRPIPGIQTTAEGALTPDRRGGGVGRAPSHAAGSEIPRRLGPSRDFRPSTVRQHQPSQNQPSPSICRNYYYYYARFTAPSPPGGR